MPGELSISKLLCTLKPALDPRTFVFFTLSPEQQQHPLAIPFGDIQMTFQEKEGLTVITTLDIAEKYGFEYFYRSKMVTMDVHSSLEAVGFMKVISGRLADEEVSANVVSAYYHDHVFVAEEAGEKVVRILEKLAEEARKEASGLYD